MTFSPLEYHIIRLKTITDLIDSVLNHDILELNKEPSKVEIHLKNEVNLRFYSIVLVDLLSNFKSDNELDFIGSKKMKGIEILLEVANNPMFTDVDASTLQMEVNTFKSWLEEEIVVENVSFQSIGFSDSLKVKRESYIYICGNISKHCFPKLSVVAKKIKNILDDNLCKKELVGAITIIPEFYDWFHTNVFAYSTTLITEMLNNIRWAIQEYLTPVYKKAYASLDDKGMYEFKMPPEVTTGFGKSCFWELMNEVRRKPYIEKFSTPSYLRQRY